MKRFDILVLSFFPEALGMSSNFDEKLTDPKEDLCTWLCQNALRNRREISICELLEDCCSFYLEYLSFLKSSVEQLKSEGWKGVKLEMTTKKAVPGIGNPGFYEFGFHSHPLFGIPYIPGSSIKGSFRRIFRFLREEDVIFGSEERSGCALFMDALPSPSSKISLEIMSPHATPRYSRSGELDDSTQPIPHCYLSISGAFYSWILVPPRSYSDREEEAISEFLQRLSSSSTLMVIGGKASSGYGWFEVRGDVL